MYPDWGIWGNRGMGIWAENAVWYDGRSLWERLPRNGCGLKLCTPIGPQNIGH